MKELKLGDEVIYHHYATGKCKAKVIGLYKDFVWLELDQPIKAKVSFKLGNIHCEVLPID
jgi:hypothetical protein